MQSDCSPCPPILLICYINPPLYIHLRPTGLYRPHEQVSRYKFRPTLCVLSSLVIFISRTTFSGLVRVRSSPPTSMLTLYFQHLLLLSCVFTVVKLTVDVFCLFYVFSRRKRYTGPVVHVGSRLAGNVLAGRHRRLGPVAPGKSRRHINATRQRRRCVIRIVVPFCFSWGTSSAATYWTRCNR